MIPESTQFPYSEDNPSVPEVEEDLEAAENKLADATMHHLSQMNISSAATESLDSKRVPKSLSEQQEISALKIQSFYRGLKARRFFKKATRHALKAQDFYDAVSYLDRERSDIDSSKSKELGQIPSGIAKTKVYLTDRVVIKLSGRPANRIRYEQMKEAREIIEKPENQFTTLFVPEGRFIGHFMLESRLPITFSLKEQMGLYLAHKEEFTQAAADFTGFLCQCTLLDTSDSIVVRTPKRVDLPYGRYENVPLYLEKGQGRIGLVDLETFSNKCNKVPKDWCFKRCVQAVRLFPYHLKTIVAVARKYDRNIDSYSEKLEKERDSTLKAIKFIYEDHLAFLEKRGITPVNPGQFPKIEKIQLSELKKEIWGLISTDKENIGRLKEQFDKIFPEIMDLVLAFVKHMVEKNIINAKGVSSKDQLLSCRSLFFDQFTEEFQILIKKIDSLVQTSVHELPVQIIKAVLNELVKQNAILYYSATQKGHTIYC